MKTPPNFARNIARISGASAKQLTVYRSAQLHAGWLVGMALAIACLRATLAHFRLANQLVWLVLGTLIVCSVACETFDTPGLERLLKYTAIGCYGAKPLLNLFLHFIS